MTAPVPPLTVLLALGWCLAPALGAVLEAGDFGAKGDGVIDDTAALQRALDAAGQAPGSTVHVPCGSYVLAGSLRVPASTTLGGDFVGPGGLSGTILLVTGGHGRSDGPAAIALAGGKSTLRGFALRYPDQSPEEPEPVPYPYAISGGHSARIEDVFMLNPYQGINLDASHAAMVRNVWGEPLRVGIHVDHCYDIVRMEDVHLWPYFTLGKPMRAWVQANGVAFEFGRSDWQSCRDTFCYGYHTGYRFYRTEEARPDPATTYAAGTTNGSFVGIGADRVAIGIDVEDSFAIGISVTNGAFAPFGASPHSRAVLLRAGNTGNISLTNCTFWAVPGTLIEVQSGTLSLNACNIHEWALHDKGAPCLLQTGGRLSMQACVLNQGGYLARIAGDTARATLAGNLGTDPLTVQSEIGECLVLSANNPEVQIGR